MTKNFPTLSKYHLGALKKIVDREGSIASTAGLLELSASSVHRMLRDGTKTKVRTSTMSKIKEVLNGDASSKLSPFISQLTTGKTLSQEQLDRIESKVDNLQLQLNQLREFFGA